MGKIASVHEVPIDKLRPYPNNAKKHGSEQIERIKASISEFGFLTPCLIDADFNLIAGHGRLEAAKQLGMKKVPCVSIEGLTEAQRKAYILADNRLGELGEWDMGLVEEELIALDSMDFTVELTGFDMPESADWFESRERNDDARQEGNDEYNAFLDKFEIKKTTDDCYTPDVVYDAVADWVADKYKVTREKFVRPFYPNGDYQKEEYPEGCVVVDNPPFSILTEIINFYCENKVRFFLFAPTLTLFGSGRGCDVCYIPCDLTVVYENGAAVNTSFVTNMETARVKSEPSLYKTANEAVEEYRNELKRELPKYSYPNQVITSPNVGRFTKYGVPFEVSPDECERIAALDMQKENDKDIFGGGFLISEKAAAEKAAAEKAAAEKAAAEKAAAEKAAATVWELSEREWDIVKSLGKS